MSTYVFEALIKTLVGLYHAGSITCEEYCDTYIDLETLYEKAGTE